MRQRSLQFHISNLKYIHNNKTLNDIWAMSACWGVSNEWRLSIVPISRRYWCCCCCCCCHRYVATEMPLRYRKLVSKMSRCYKVIAGLWAAALITFIAPILTKPDWIYYRYNVNQKMCGLHWEYPVYVIINCVSVINDVITSGFVREKITKRRNRGYSGWS